MFTVGHSTRSLEGFLELSRAGDVRCLVDVRRYPGSRRHPHFGRDVLAATAGEIGIRYVHEPRLGGWRSARADSPITGWPVGWFRGYADHLATPEFAAGLERLEEAAAAERTAIICAEAEPGRCHRQLVADVLVLRGWEVRHMLAAGQTREHRLHPAARLLADGRVIYPAPEGSGA